MALTSIKQILAEANLATPVEFSDLTKEWRVAAENGSEEPLLAFFAREKGLTEEAFLEGEHRRPEEQPAGPVSL